MWAKNMLLIKKSYFSSLISESGSDTFFYTYSQFYWL